MYRLRGNNLSVGIKYLSIFVWPILTLFFFIQDYNQKYAKNLLWLFCIFYGMIHIVFNEQGFYVDGMAYALALEEKGGDYGLKDLLESLYSEDTTTPDLFMPLITFLISRFTTDYRVLFVVLAFVYGYFYSRNVWLALNLKEGRKSTFLMLLLLSFIMTLPICQINGRFWLGAQVFFYGVSYYFVSGKQKYLWWCACAALIHFAHIASIFAFVLYYFLPKKSSVYFWILLGTLFISSINIQSLNNLLASVVPSAFERKVDVYANVEYLQHRLETDSKSLHVLFVNGLKDWLFRIMLLLFYWKYKQTILRNRIYNKAFCFVAVFSIVASVFAFVPSASRYLNLAAMFTVFFIVWVADSNTVYTSIFRNVCIRYIISCCLAFFILFQIRSIFEHVGISFFISNPLIALFFEDNFPLFYYIKF